MISEDRGEDLARPRSPPRYAPLKPPSPSINTRILLVERTPTYGASTSATPDLVYLMRDRVSLGLLFARSHHNLRPRLRLAYGQVKPCSSTQTYKLDLLGNKAQFRTGTSSRSSSTQHWHLLGWQPHLSDKAQFRTGTTSCSSSTQIYKPDLLGNKAQFHTGTSSHSSSTQTYKPDQLGT
ncbi:hypothetical protein F511_17851 [Dorcoceras hygrometricum]|uniref:Uncharacterized protein n=1 Tax=Dorcoceras hygrometricum TaxID=472368 RepID=A0A2Z7C6A8_9LAMI|nr:hypothetical protein F511_17851 [Dorcoceras hygrometricum]